MAEFAWTPNTIIRLLKEFEKRPTLWNPYNELYRLPTAKYQAWSELAGIFQCDIGDIRKKLNSVFASHRREKAKVLRGDRSTWKLYQHLSFLPHHVKNVEPKVSYVKDVYRQEYLNEDNEVEEVTFSDTSEPQIKQESEPARSKLNAKRRLTIKRPVKKRIIKTSDSTISELRLLEMLKSLKRTDCLKRKKDECDTFGEYIAESLRKHDDRTQAMIKQAINNILFEQEMKKYNSEQYTVVIANDEENPLILEDQDK